MRPIFFAMVLACGLFASTLASAQPSYDCSVQLNATERTICGDDRLARLDREMASKFERLYSQLAPERAQVFRQQQTRWRLNDRDACGPSAGCIRANYAYRIGVFDRMLGHATGEETSGPPEITRSASARVLPDGTIERLLPDGTRIRYLPGGGIERYDPDGRKTTAYAYSQVPYAGLPPLPPTYDGWASDLQASLAGILDNILTDDEYAAYENTEAGKADYVLIDWRLRSISLLTQP
jgi:uncharacterized protein YecT (DUF1311 family)